VTEGRRVRIIGYLCALGAGAVWGTTGPLSTALYREGQAITGVGFWRLLIGTAGLALWALLVRRDLFRIDRHGLLLMGGLGGFLVALFEVAYQFGIAGAGVAGAAALLYTAPVMVALVARPLLGERLTALRLGLAVAVMVGAAMTVIGGSQGTGLSGVALPSILVGVTGGLLSAVSYATTTVLARWAVPRYGQFRMLFWEAIGGVVILAVTLPLAGHAPKPPPTGAGWIYAIALAAGGVIIANLLFFTGVRRIEATPTAVAATIEPVVGALLAFLLFSQHLTTLGVIGLLMVVGGVATGYLKEGAAEPTPPA
jgi:DME family drug/metabolite transporter